jgi:hypothetical protein
MLKFMVLMCWLVINMCWSIGRTTNEKNHYKVGWASSTNKSTQIYKFSVVEKYLELGGPYGCPIFDQ